MINLMIIYDVVNIFSMKNYEYLRKLRVGVNGYAGVNWSTTTTKLGFFEHKNKIVYVMTGRLFVFRLA